MAIRNPNGSETELFMGGNNKTRWNEVRAIQEKLVAEGADCFDNSSLPSSPQATTGKAAAPSTSTGGNSALAAQIAELKCIISKSKAYGGNTEPLEAKLRELEAAPSASGKKVNYNQAKHLATQANNAENKAIDTVVQKQFELDEAKDRMAKTCDDRIKADALVKKLFAEEAAAQGKQQTIINIQQLLDGELPQFDISGIFVQETGELERDEKYRQMQVTAIEALKQAFLPIATARAEEKAKAAQKMAVDEANVRKPDDAADDEPDRKRRAAEAVDANGVVQQVVATPSPGPCAADPKHVSPDAKTSSAASSSKEGGQPTPPTSKTQAADDKKAKATELRAKVAQEGRDAALARAVAAGIVGEGGNGPDVDAMEADQD